MQIHTSDSARKLTLIGVNQQLRSEKYSLLVKQNAFELLSGETWRDPFKMYKNLRKNHPIYYLEEKNLWILSKFEDVFNAARNPEIFSSQNGLTVDSDSADFEMGDVSPMVFLDPPEHTELRRLVSKDFYLFFLR